jgi:hypothetical protein
MNKEQAEQLAWRILGEVEEMMWETGMALCASDPGCRFKVPAYFEDRQYKALEKTIVGILLETNKVQAVMHAESLDGHDC